MSTETGKTTRRAALKSADAPTKRRDGDPVRVYPDGRIWYWTGGRPGAGERRQKRCGSLEEAEKQAAALRIALARTNGQGAHVDSVLDQAMQDMLATMRAEGAPRGTISQYKSNWNCWVPGEIGGKVRCLDTDIRHWTAIFDHANAEGASESTVRNIARTLGALTDWAVDRGYFASSEPFGDPRRRRKVVKQARKRAAIRRAESDRHFFLKVCPKVSDIEKYGAALEEVYPGYGRSLVLLAFATGLRISELLALRHDSIDLKTGDVRVDWQLDRHQHWPARKPPKNGKPRVALLWSYYNDVAEELIQTSLSFGEDDARYGWLFPPHRSKTSWVDRAGVLAREARIACEWNWTFHWLRHANATYSLASKKHGGYRMEIGTVSALLGHSRPSITQDMYVERQSDDVEGARKVTKRRPG